ncbi:MAG TPA: hypothetical protein VGH73_07770 [Thermoanaerobaculia bacterium]
MPELEPEIGGEGLEALEVRPPLSLSIGRLRLAQAEPEVFPLLLHVLPGEPAGRRAQHFRGLVLQPFQGILARQAQAEAFGVLDPEVKGEMERERPDLGLCLIFAAELVPQVTVR